jgi:hypothetical protein
MLLEEVLVEPKDKLNACAELGAITEEAIATPAASKEQPTKVEKMPFISVKTFVELEDSFGKALLTKLFHH